MIQVVADGGRRVAAGKASSPGVPMPVPLEAGQLEGHYDLTISQPRPDQPHYAVFCHMLAEAAVRYGLSCALIHQRVVHEAVRRLQVGEMTVGLHLDCDTAWHVADDPFARLAFAVQDAGGHPINLPARSRAFTDKAAAHAELIRHELGVAPTVVIRPWSPARDLTVEECAFLRLQEAASRVLIKSAHASGGKGVVAVDQPTPGIVGDALAEARRRNPADTFLVQAGFRPPLLAGDDGVARPASWRIFHCLGEVTAFWWSPSDQEGQVYRELSTGEVERHGLHPLFHFVQSLADLSGLEWFCTELALCPFPAVSRFHVNAGHGQAWPVVAVDYLDDRCDVDVESRRPGAPPDDFVQGVAWRFAELAWVIRQKKAPLTGKVRRAG